MDLALDDLLRKERALHALLRQYGSVLVAYSGGVDSAYLAKAALDVLGPQSVLAVTGRSPSYPAEQYEIAVAVADSIGLPRLEIETDELDDPSYAANPVNRCYYCKVDLYSRLEALARERGLAAIVDGCNADDLSDHRPGLKAARELDVRSPLQEVGLTKAEIRVLSRQAGLPTWNMPASPCLASRISYGTPVTIGRLRRIEEAESRLRAIGEWRELRVRQHGELARLEVDAAGLARLVEPELRARAARALKHAGYTRACLDLRGYRRGALNEARGPGTKTDSPGDGTPALEAERRLLEIGIRARVTDAGPDGEIAVLQPVGDSISGLLTVRRDAALERCEAAGFRYVAVELSDACFRRPEPL